MVKFLVNEEPFTLEGVCPHGSVLDFLREHLRQTGTKEGCASGDCGACTVVLGEVLDGAMQYRSINACITPVATLHGKQLITVEHLKYEERLHPTQQAMVDCHGSQCGFCTPGFVMSMFAYRKNHAEPERESIIEALGGNLCRCTGYRPIMDAAVQMYEPSLEDQFSAGETATAATLSDIIDAQPTVALKDSVSDKQFYSPDSVEQLAALMLEHPQARLLAGGTDLCLEFTQFLREMEILIYTGRVAQMLEIKESDDTIEIGAAVTYSDCHDILVSQFPDLGELLERLGSLQIRNQGTLGGNIGNASPIGDMPPVLIALGASLVLRVGDSTRVLSVEDYYLSYKKTAQQESEFIQSIIVPKPQPGFEFRAYKISKRLEDDISATCAAISIFVDQNIVRDVRIAFGGMAEIPARAFHCEQSLLGQPWSEASIEQAMEALNKDFTPISDFRASAEYRLQVSQGLLKRFYLDLNSSTEDLRVTHYA